MLEHRFYGESLPEHPVATALSVEYLRFLTVEQALADLKAFIAMVDASEGEGGPWVAFGGSYPGALSSWFRGLYPNATIASLSSSGVRTRGGEPKRVQSVETARESVSHESKRCHRGLRGCSSGAQSVSPGSLSRCPRRDSRGDAIVSLRATSRGTGARPGSGGVV